MKVDLIFISPDPGCCSSRSQTPNAKYYFQVVKTNPNPDYIHDLCSQSQISTIQTDISSNNSSTEKSLQLKISELLAMLEQRQATVSRQEEVRRRHIHEQHVSIQQHKVCEWEEPGQEPNSDLTHTRSSLHSFSLSRQNLFSQWEQTFDWFIYWLLIKPVKELCVYIMCSGSPADPWPLPSGDPKADAGEKRQLQECHQDHHHQEVQLSHTTQEVMSLHCSCILIQLCCPVLESDDSQSSRSEIDRHTLLIPGWQITWWSKMLQSKSTGLQDVSQNLNL